MCYNTATIYAKSENNIAPTSEYPKYAILLVFYWGRIYK
jgi:hypothetical protein